jgi:predicted Zn-dependent peptidase
MDKWLNRIQQVTREEIVAVAENIDLDTIYFLTGTEGK